MDGVRHHRSASALQRRELDGGGQPEWRLSSVRISMSRRSASRASAQVLRTAAVTRVTFEPAPFGEAAVECDMVDQILRYQRGLLPIHLVLQIGVFDSTL